MLFGSAVAAIVNLERPRIMIRTTEATILVRFTEKLAAILSVSRSKPTHVRSARVGRANRGGEGVGGVAASPSAIFAYPHQTFSPQIHVPPFHYQQTDIDISPPFVSP